MQHRNVEHAIALTLAGQGDHVDWSAFSLTDWQHLIESAQAGGVAPLLHKALEEGPGRMASPFHSRSFMFHCPPSIVRELHAAYCTTAARNLFAYQELARIVTALREVDQPSSAPHSSQQTTPPIILLKGAALAATLYPDIALRPMRDLDLLLPRRHLQPALQAVKALGYREVGPQMRPGLEWPVGYHVHLRGGPHHGVDLELHQGLIASSTDWRSPSLDWFWNQTEPFNPSKGAKKRKGGERIPPMHFRSLAPLLILTPTAHLLYLAAHLMLQHGGAKGRLLWHYDIHLLISRWSSEIDWDELLDRAQAFHWQAALQAALLETRTRFDTPLPGRVLETLVKSQDSRSPHFGECKEERVQTEVARTWTELKALDWPTRLRLAWSIACPTPAYLRWRYDPKPSWLWPLCYVYRWFEILRDGLLTVWQLVR